MAKQTKKVIEARVQQLTSLGFTVNDAGHYVKGDKLIPKDTIEFSSADTWDLEISILSKTTDVVEEAPDQDVVTEGEVIHLNEAIDKLDVDKKNKAVIAEWKKLYAGLTITGITDKENYKKVAAAKSFIRKKRTTIEKTRKDLKAGYLEAGRKIDNVAKEYADLIAEIEEPLDKQIDQWEAWENEEKERLEQEARKEINRRTDLLKSSGMEFNGSYYVCGENIFMDVITIQSMSLDEFDKFVEKVKAEKKRLDDEAAETMRKQQEELENLKQQRLQMRSTVATSIGLLYSETVDDGRPGYYFTNPYGDFIIGMWAVTDTDDGVFGKTIESTSAAIKEAKQKEIDAANQKMEQEKENLRRQKITLREGMAKTIGMIFSVSMPGIGVPGYIFKNDFADFSLGMDVIKNASDDEYQKSIEDYGSKISQAKQQQVDADKQAADEKERLRVEQEQRELKEKEQYIERQNSLVNLGMALVMGEFIRKNEFGDKVFITVAEVKALDADMWHKRLLELEQSVKGVNALTDSKLRAIEQEKEALKPQIQKAREYISNILNLPKPDIDDPKIKDVLSKLSLAMTAAMNEANNRLLECE